jgi:tuberculosinol/isotuberculosinol synthase
MPLISTGREDLYYSIPPSPYFTQTQLREILYDHLFARQKEKVDYATIAPEKWAELRTYYQANLNKTVGIGHKDNVGFWHPDTKATPSS